MNIVIYVHILTTHCFIPHDLIYLESIIKTRHGITVS